ncbi:alpha/beta hydrolase family protein [Kitasatospora phosalacinea]|uniref:Alpha/beta hydrolase family protein n=1 Tax=Kitasatospora phosalacinea TaxID=2065 RepID=A0ABW6GRS0_9ACTN
MKRSALPAIGLTAAALLLAATGCGSDPASGTSAGTAAAAAAEDFGCLTPEQAAAGSVRLAVPGGEVGAYYRDSDAGKATVGLVLAPQAGGSLCDWQPHYAEFTAAGYAVVGWMVSGGGPGDVRAAMALLKSKGVTSVALIGASKGASAALETAADPAGAPLPVKAVVSLSSPDGYPGESNAAKAVLAGTVPTLFAAEEGDGRFPETARQLHDTAVTPVKQLKLYPGGNHGAALLADGALPDVRAFLAAHAPARG